LSGSPGVVQQRRREQGGNSHPRLESDCSPLVGFPCSVICAVGKSSQPGKNETDVVRKEPFSVEISVLLAVPALALSLPNLNNITTTPKGECMRKTHLRKSVLLAIPMAGLLGFAPLGFAHDEYQEHRAEHQNLNAEHSAEHQDLNAEHRAEHQNLEAQHEAAHQYPMTKRQHRRLHRQLSKAHEAGHEELNAEHRAEHQELNAEHQDYHDYNR